MLINSNLEIFKSSKILIVDDIPENVEVMANMLKILGANLFFATSGSQALSIAAVKKPDLILLDIQMPGMDGYTVCKQIKLNQETKDTPIIFLTAKTEAEDLIMAFESGGVDYITKPFNIAELTVRVKTHLELKKTKDFISKQNQEIIDIQQKIARDAQRIMIMNDELQETQAQLKSMNSAKDRLFNVISKDLKNPIQSLLFASETLSRHIDKLSAEELETQHKNIYQNVRYMSKQMDNLLHWAKLQLGGVSVYIENLDLVQLIEKNLKALSVEIEKKDLTIIKEYPDNFKALLDKNTMNTVIHNILDNAVLNSHQNGTIFIKAQDKANFTALSIIDNGVGMENDLLLNLFDSNYIFQHRNKCGQGIGLGLLISQELAKLNNCNILADSRIGEGSNFSIFFKKY